MVLRESEKILIFPWINYSTKNQHLEYHLLNCLRDQYEQDYDIWSRPEWVNFILNAYGHSFWITANPNPTGPLPPWFFALVILEAPGQFPRLSLGHENQRRPQGFGDVLARVVREYIFRQRLTEVFPPNHLFRRNNQNFLLEVVRWIKYLAQPYPTEYKPFGVRRIPEILADCSPDQENFSTI